MRRAVRNFRRGRAQKLLSGATAASALPLGVEIYVNHYGGSFGNKWMWTPVALSPALSAAGLYFHLRGIARKPGGFKEASYNLVMGPPALAPGSLAMVGAIGLAAAVSRRER